LLEKSVRYLIQLDRANSYRDEKKGKSQKEDLRKRGRKSKTAFLKKENFIHGFKGE